MPEIKNTFLKGKMNKDLDERLVPNGEYVDAMNVQVSTSEGSDVGTAQNILGNYLIPGQSYFARNDTGFYQKLIVPLNDEFEDYQCVGVISDEANDKLYFFTTYSKEIYIENADFKTDFSGWTQAGGNIFTHNQKLGAIGNHQATGMLVSDTTVNLVDGKTYEVFYDITKTNTFDLNDILFFQFQDTATSTVQSMQVNFHDTNRPGTFSTKFLKSGDSDQFAIFKQDFYTGAIDNIKIYEVRSSRILEYNTRTKEITPIFIDQNNEVLKFQPNNIITGINIIDDLLFWTDNYGEPKKISIQRSKKGTNFKANNFQHTQLVRDTLENGLLDGEIQDIEERHITVIKPAPKTSLNYIINKQDTGDVNAGIFRITPSTQDTTVNNSSLRTYNEISAAGNFAVTETMNNFSGKFGSVGYEFVMYVEEDINGQSGFTLNFSPGDLVRLKAFNYQSLGNNSYSFDQPSLPLEDWSIKAKVLDWPYNQFSDAANELNPNPDFTFASGSATKPAGYDSDNSTGTGYFVYDSANSNMIINQPANTGVNAKFITPNLTSIVLTNSYTVTIKVSNHVSGTLNARLITSSAGYPLLKMEDFGDEINSDGEFVFVIPANTSTYTTPSWTNASWANELYLSPRDSTGFEGTVERISVINNEAQNALVALQIVATQGSFSTVPAGLEELKCVIEKDEEQQRPFESKFPRFSYRWRYADGEYSTIAPFTNVVFEPSSFSYHPTKGYNLGMQNTIKSVELSNWQADCPEDVIEAEILYRDEVSPNIYIVDTLTRTGNNRFVNGMNIGGSTNGSYLITTETLKSALPTDQVLRSWDAVPRKALAQDITGNRIVYANYVQGYNLDDLNNKIGVNEYDPDLNFTVISDEINNTVSAVPSIKSLREYQLGVVFVDEYGRETPVISNSTLFDTVEKERSKNKNKFRVSFTNDHYPKNMKYMKFFIKESSGEYYNMAMDRWYDAGDNNVWISFPSSEINKINIDSYLILKKGLESHQQVVQKARYKVLAIENEPPDEIQFKKIKFESKAHDISSISNEVFVEDIGDSPLENSTTFKLRYPKFYDGTAGNLQDINDDIYIEFEDTANNVYSNRYKITSVTTDYDGTSGTLNGSTYSFTLSKPFGSDINFLYNDSQNPTAVRDGMVVNLYKYIIDNRNEFAGRFFVKILNDDIFHTEVISKNANEDNLRIAKSRKLYFMNHQTHNFNHNGYWTHQNDGVYANDATYTLINKYGGGLPEYDSTISEFPWVENGAWTTPNSTGAVGHQPNGGGYLIENRPNHFGRFAPFFRDYRHKKTSSTLFVSPNASLSGNTIPASSQTKNTSSSTGAGQYKFGADANNWAFEINYITTPINSKYQGFNLQSGVIQYHVTGSGPGLDNVSTFNTGSGTPHGVTSLSHIKYADNQWKDNNQRAGVFDKFERQLHGDVWFIDAGSWEGQRNEATESMHFEHINTSPSQEAGISTTGGSINISIGGVYSNEVADSPTAEDRSLANYFATGFTRGDGETNPFYDVDDTRRFVQQLTPGSKFRWRDDPNKEVYTVGAGLINRRLIRAMATEWPYIKNWGTGNGNHPNASSSVETGEYHGDLTNAAAQLSPNFTRGWKLKYENSSGGTDMLWDPTNGGTLGPIPNGLYLPCTGAQIRSVVNHDTHVTLNLNSLTCTDPVFGQRDIREGMIITSYNNGGVTLNNSSSNTYQNQELLVETIQTSKEINPSATDFYYVLTLVGYRALLSSQTNVGGGATYNGAAVAVYRHTAIQPGGTAISASQQIIFEQAAMNGYSQYSVNRINASDWCSVGHEALTKPGLGAVGYHIEFLEDNEAESKMPENPAIWETEPPETTTDVDLYYEASGAIPFVIDLNNYRSVITAGSTIAHVGNPSSVGETNKIYNFGFRSPDNPVSTGLGANEAPNNASYTGATSGYWIHIADEGLVPFQSAGAGGAGQPTAGEPPLVSFATGGGATAQFISVGDKLKIIQPSGFSVEVKVLGYYDPYTTGATNNRRFYKFFIDPNIYADGISSELSWNNCYSFGNGVESNRIRDTFNLTRILNGVKVSTTFDPYREEHRKHGLIYSGIYNSVSGSNNLNQFIAANKITKDINPIYGSIQKLHARDTDLITLCEDKILKILSNKDAVFNADGNPQLTANENVLGQAMPFVGEYGISTNPESFASEAYRAYFTDKVRGTVMRLSMDGLTPISDHGMKDWFRDNLKLNNTIIGSYDDKKDEYNVTLKQTDDETINRLHGGVTVSFREDVKGWSSFKSFVPDHAISCANEYYTFNKGLIYHHHNEKSLRNTFYLDYAEVESVGPHPVNFTGSLGHYAWFNAETLIKKYDTAYQFFSSTSFTTSFTLKIKQYRKGILIYNGIIDVFKASDVNFLRNEKGERLAHCRRAPRISPSEYGPNVSGNNISQEGDWEIGDIIVFENINSDSTTTLDPTGVKERYAESSINVLLNQDPGVVKTYHTLSYEGSQAKTTGLRSVKVIDDVYHDPNAGFADGRHFYIDPKNQGLFFDIIQPDSSVPGANYVRSTVNVKQYRVPLYTGGYLGGQTLGPVLVREGVIRYYANSGTPNGMWDAGTAASDWQIGDIITTELEEKSVNSFDYIPHDGWYIEDIKTNKQEGSLIEFLDKEGKWFNNIKGKNHNTGNTSEIDLKSANVQGIGIISDYTYETGYLPNSQNKITIHFENEINKSLQIGDKLYSERTTSTLGPNLLPPLEIGNYTGFGVNVSYATNPDGTPNMILQTNANSLGSPVNTNAGVSSLGFELEHTKIYQFKITFDEFDDNLNNVTNPFTSADIFFVYGTGYMPTWTPSAAPFGFNNQIGGTRIRNFTFNKNLNNGDLENILRIELKPGTGSTPTHKYVKIERASLREFIPGDSFGLTQIKADELFYLGTVLSLTNKTITVATSESSAATWLNDYVMFVKPEVINTSSLIGYFADINIKNNSLVKAELFSVASEITESSR